MITPDGEVLPTLIALDLLPHQHGHPIDCEICKELRDKL